MSCNRCGPSIYMGKMENLLKVRVQNHLYMIRSEDCANLSPRHFGSDISDLSINGIECVNRIFEPGKKAGLY